MKQRYVRTLLPGCISMLSPVKIPRARTSNCDGVIVTARREFTGHRNQKMSGVFVRLEDRFSAS